MPRTLYEIAAELELAHQALTEAGQAMSGSEEGSYELHDATGRPIPSLSSLAAEVRAHASSGDAGS